jgi:hypothetical protein
MQKCELKNKIEHIKEAKDTTQMNKGPCSKASEGPQEPKMAQKQLEGASMWPSGF